MAVRLTMLKFTMELSVLQFVVQAAVTTAETEAAAKAMTVWSN